MEDLVLAASQWLGWACEGEVGLAAHWKLDESGGSVAADSSGSGYSGMLAGAKWNPSGGVLGGALQFDGVNDYVWVTQGYRGITGSNPRTCSAWIRTGHAPGEIMTWGDQSVAGCAWIMWLDEIGVLRVDVGQGYVAGTTYLADDLWHHVAVTSDGSTTDRIIFYVDGRIETIGHFIPQSINSQGTATVKLGVAISQHLTGKYFDGLIDDARIYGRILTDKEIWTLATTGTTDYACPDFNTDGTVNLRDLARLSQNWADHRPQVLINEFLADNESKSPLGPRDILDGNGEASDWIELYNNSQEVIDIGGWYLTDDYSRATKWRFPTGTEQLVLQPGDYLVVFASGKTEAENPGNYPYIDSAGYLHTNFQLSKNGEYLGLIDDDGHTPIHEYNHFELGGGKYGYPPQQNDISYGSYYDEQRHFSQPTPGAANRSSFDGFVEKPDVNIKGGCYVSGFDLTMSCGTHSAFICYTTDGTVPSPVNGQVYTVPIHIDGLTTLIARAFKPGLQPSDARIETYLFIDPAVSSFNSNLPIVVIDTLGVTVPQDKINKPWTPCRAVIIDTDDTTGRAHLTGPEHFEGIAQIRYRGESTYGTKRHFAFEVQDEYGQGKDVFLLGMPAESDWVITGEKLDYTLLKCEIAFKWFRDMGHYAPRQRYVEVYLNEGGGAISTDDYKGIFVLREKIKRSKTRVDIARLDTSHNLEPKVSGGYIIKCDKLNDGDTLLTDFLETAPYGIQTTGNGKPILTEPGPLKVTGPQIEWITDYINELHAVLWQNTSSSYYPGPGPEYTDYIDVISWIDHFIVEQTCADSDAFWGSYFAYKDRNGKVCSGPPWDFDRGFHNNAGSASPYDVWKTNGAIFGKWHERLQQDPEYSMRLADRWFEHRRKVLNTTLTMAYIDETFALITEAMGRSIDKYGFPGSGGTYAGEIVLFKNWITTRLDWLDGEIGNRFAKKPPIITPAGGHIAKGSAVSIMKPSGAAGTVYYTLNGEDPRLEGGSINPEARPVESSQIVLNQNAWLRARINYNGEWSAQNREFYAVDPVLENLRITEIMYHPANPTQAEKDMTGNANLVDTDFEFIEFKNIGTDDIHLNLVSFTNGVEFTFGDYTIGAGRYAVAVRNEDAFRVRYPDVPASLITGTYAGALDNSGERITLVDAVGMTIHDFAFKDGWYDITDGHGFSLTIRDAAAPVSTWGEKDGWRPSAAAGGSPGYDDTGVLPAPGSIVINEVLAHSHAAAPDWIELHNTTGAPINIGGWFLSDNDTDPMKYEIAAGVSIPEKGYVVFYEDQHFNNAADPGCHTPFGLSENGETVYLTSGLNGVMTGYTVQEDFNASETDISFGRYRKSTGTYNFIAMSDKTPGYANAYPKIGPVVISEIMYNPSGNADAEYVEMLNITDGDVTLYDDGTGVPWIFQDGGGFTFTFPTTPVTLAAGERLLLVKDLAAFSTAFTPAAATQILVWSSGSLNNGGEQIQLAKPGDVDALGTRRYIRVDRVVYSDGSHPDGDESDPWPPAADGNGSALHRIVATEYGNDIANWQAGPPTPGT
ncbi:MAG: lamin tail domain-containing protein [Phycisphaerae bacterium]|nr:lamin tail domain-containing protein [Phycisphaerae bacterium]